MGAGANTCRACGAPIRWAITTAKGRRIPLDPEPRPDGNLHLDYYVDYIAKDDPAPPPASQRYVAHFATCPKRARRRRSA